jgi:hypothetical protein
MKECLYKVGNVYSLSRVLSSGPVLVTDNVSYAYRKFTCKPNGSAGMLYTVCTIVC